MITGGGYIFGDDQQGPALFSMSEIRRPTVRRSDFCDPS